MANKATLVSRLLAVKERSGKTWSEIGRETGLTNVYVAQLFRRQAPLKPHAVEALRSALPELPDDLINEMMKPPMRSFEPTLIQDPAVYRLHEAVMHYGESIKEIINEDFGDGIATYSQLGRSFDGDYAITKKLRGLKISTGMRKALSIMCSRGCPANENRYASLLQECVDVKDLKTGKCIHGHTITFGFVPDQYLRTKILIMYCKNVDMYSAHQVFDRMSERNLVSWNGMIFGYVESGRYEEAFRFYDCMLSLGVMPDQFTFASVFKACAGLAKLELGRRAHGELIKSRITENVIVNSAVVDMYCKCSSVIDARRVFESISVRNVVTWTSLISGYGQHGDVEEVLQLFHRMISEGLRPNHITFLVVLCACSHAGLDGAAWKCFNLMTKDYGMNPKAEHCAAMVDLLARSGRLDEAHEFVKMLPFEHHSVLWGTLLGASRVHGHLELAKLASDRFFKLEPENAGKYVVLSNVYAARGLWRKVAEVREVMRENGIKKETACSWIEVQRGLHSFLVRDKSHPRTDEIYKTIKSLTIVLKDAGYTPDIID